MQTSESTQTSPCENAPVSFEELAASRRQWIDTILHPWCLQASLKQLRQVEAEWHDIAGRVDLKATLWTWAWERFPGLTHPDLAGVDETHPIRVTLKNGSTVEGFPDSRESLRGMLSLVSLSVDAADATDPGPWSIDDIQSVERIV